MEIPFFYSFSKSWDHLVTSIRFSTTHTQHYNFTMGTMFSKEMWRKSS